ncbi:repetitive proline-rich cell wall protein [Colletotrichum simmondsii]|nr:repetitive proline-rich cell wall protein [Colletotrichum simmondsii]
MGVAEPCRASPSSSFVDVVQPRLLAAVALRTPGGVCLIFRFRVNIAPLAAVSPFGRDDVVHLHTPQDSSYTSDLTYPIELSSSHSLSSRFFPTARLHLQDRLSSYHTLGVLVLYTLPKVLLHGSGRGRSAVHMAQDYCKPQWRSPTSVGRRAEMSSHPSHSASSSPHPLLKRLSLELKLSLPQEYLSFEKLSISPPPAAMKFTTALLALAATALATEDHDWGKDKTKTIVTEVLTTYTTVCPVTITKPGEHTTQYETITTTSTVVEKHPTTIYETLPGATEVVTEIDTDYTTYTTYCPITETIVGEGTTKTVVYTTLSTVVEKKPTKIIETVPGPTAVVTATDVQLTTLTSLCPVTETYTEGGKTWTKTYTTTSTIVTHVPTKVWQTEKLPDVTKTEKDVEYTTITSLCPVTETKTIGGETVVVTYTSTSTIVTEVPTKVDVWTTVKTTQHLSTEVYETITKPVTTYQTIEHGETVWITATGTKTITVEKVHTLTEVIVETKTAHVEVTQAVTVGGESVVTQKSWVYITVSGTVYATQTRPASTLVVPTTSAVTLPPVTVSSQAPVVVPTAAADARRAPGAALLAGLFGAVALL